MAEIRYLPLGLVEGRTARRKAVHGPTSSPRTVIAVVSHFYESK